MDEYNLVPADTYIVFNKSILNNDDRKILSMLYQPIVGPNAIMLYFSLWSDLDKTEIISNEFTHHHLITNMQMTTLEIVNARKKLEAVGLIKTYVKEDSVNNYVYELYSPISAHDFFNHPILNIVLYNNVGKMEYEKLINYFKLPRINLSSYKNITSSFSDVYETVPLTNLALVNEDIRKYNKLSLNINSNFDLNFLIASMPKNIDTNKLFTKENRELIINMAFLYDLDVMKIQNILKGCLNERGGILKEEFRKACRNYYQFENGGLLPTLVDKTQPEYLRKPIGDTSKRAKMIYTFETISPYDLLSSKNDMGEPTRRDLKLAEDLIVEYNLKPGVVNVLLDYVLKTNNNKLTRNLVETIAGQWQRLKIDTVEEAMEVAEKEHKKYNRNKAQVKVHNKKEEHIPEWFDKEIKKTEDKELQAEMDELLKEYK